MKQILQHLSVYTLLLLDCVFQWYQCKLLGRLSKAEDDDSLIYCVLTWMPIYIFLSLKILTDDM